MYKKSKVILITFVFIFVFIFGIFPIKAVSSFYEIEDINYYRMENVYYIKNEGADIARDISLDITLGNPYLTRTNSYSTLIGSDCSPQPFDIVVDKKGNQTGKFFISQLKPNETKIIRVTQDYKAGMINYNIKPENVGDYTYHNYVLNAYLSPSPGIESNDLLIMKKAQEIADGETNPFLKAKKIFLFLQKHMTYDYKDRDDAADYGALWALQTGKGVCEDYADLMVALLRASDVPARTVAGWMGKIESGGTKIADRNGSVLPGHMWLEYYLPGYGWIPADPTYTYLVNGESKVDYSRLTGLKELCFAENSEVEGHSVAYSFYGDDVEVSFEITIKPIQKEFISKMKTGPIVLYLEGIPLIFDVNPCIENGRTLVPMRGIFQALGAEVEWDGSVKRVTARTINKDVELQIGSKKAKVNGEKVELDVKPNIIENRTMIPLRFVGEALGCQVDWDGSKRSINIQKETT